MILFLLNQEKAVVQLLTKRNSWLRPILITDQSLSPTLSETFIIPCKDSSLIFDKMHIIYHIFSQTFHFMRVLLRVISSANLLTKI